MGMQTREDDFVENMFVCNSHDYIMMFTTFGRMYKLKAYEIPEGSRQGKVMNLVNIIPLQPEEKVSMLLPCRDIDEAKYIVMGTKNGVIKKTALSAFDHVRKTGIIALELDEGDELRFVALSDGTKSLLVATKKGKAIRFAEDDVRPMGRTARGVRSIRLRPDDEVVAMAVCEDDAVILTISETGYGRRSDVADYRLQSRGGKGITNYKVEKYGDVAAVLTVTEDEDIIMISSDGVIIRIAVDGISKFARPSKGVRVMKFGKNNENAIVLSASATPHDEDEITDVADAPDADSAADAEDVEETEETAEE